MSLRMSVVSSVLGVILLGHLLVAGPAVAQETKPESAAAAEEASSPALPFSLSGFEDQGRFLLYKNEERLATMDFEWTPAGAFHSRTTIEMAGQSIEQKLEIVPDENGRWQEITLHVPSTTVEIKRQAGSVQLSARGKDYTFELTKPDSILWENMAPALASHAVLRYDAKEGGKQKLAAFLVPSTEIGVSLERNDTVERSIAGRDIGFTRYTYYMPGVDMFVWVDDQNRTCLIDVPAQKAQYVRAGYESLREPPVLDEKLSKPEFEVELRDEVMVPMRDGVKLATDIYLPKTDGKSPVVLVRTPYKKEMSEMRGRYFARRGYACALQDCRGRFGSEGEWEPFVNEAQDGYDTIEWLATQDWSSGKVGMIGASYLGWVQWWAASQNPPHLVTIIPNVAPPDPYYNIPYENGVFFLLGAFWWADVLESEATADLTGAAMHQVNDRQFAEVLRHLPVIELDQKVFEKQNPYWRKWIQNPVNGGYWDRANFLDKLEHARIPVFHQSGWFDGDGIGAKLNYLKMHSHGHPHQKLVLGPWGHTDTAGRIVGRRDFGEEAIVDLQTAYLRWFDHWLKGVDNGIDAEPLVSLFTMGSNRWLHGDEYPLPETRFQKLYLHSAGCANTSEGNGRLTFEPPGADTLPDTYAYDPGDPTPNPDYFQPPEPEEGEVRSIEKIEQQAKAHHEHMTRTRSDILVYVGQVLDKPLTIAGPISATLYAASSARDTDWFVRLMEVDKEGEIFPLVEGRLRARYRESTYKPELLEPGAIYEYHIDMWQTGITIPEGRRLRVEVASASFPYFSRNLNTGGHNEMETEYVTAEQIIYHDAAHPSHVLLPVIPE